MDKETLERFDKIDTTLDTLNKRLFIDNGDLSIQSKINKNTDDIKKIFKIFAAAWGILAFFMAMPSVWHFLEGLIHNAP